MDPYESRRARLRKLVVEKGSIATFAEEYGYTRAQISQYLSVTYNGGRSMGERAARGLEVRVGLPPGWLDVPLEQANLPGPEERMLHADREARLAHEAMQERIYPAVVGGSLNTREHGFVDIRNDTEKITTGMISRDPGVFALKLRGGHLRPRMKSGEFIAIEPSSVPHPGDDVLVQFMNEDRQILQYLYRRNDELTFGPLNEEGANVTVHETDIVLLGVVVAIMPGR